MLIASDNVLIETEEEGEKAAIDGKLLEDCPYAKGDFRRDSWITGWGDYHYQ